MANTLFNALKKASENEFAFTIDEENPYDVDEWIDTGCYALNAVLSDGDIFKGIPSGKRVMISGESGVAKSLFIAVMTAAYLEQIPNSTIIFFESEASTVVDMAKKIGIPEDRMMVLPVGTVEDFRSQAMRILDKVVAMNVEIAKKNLEIAKFNKMKKNADKQKKVLLPHKPIFVLDSLGNLGTLAENLIIAEDKRKKGKQTRDMTRASLIRGMARSIALKIAMAQIPFLLTNHTYNTMSEYEPDETSGGGGVKYMSDISLILTKAKEKEGKNQTGIIITLQVRKSRYMKENKTVKILISFTRGMYRFSDLVNKARELDILKKDGNSFLMPPDYDKEKKVAMADVRKHTSKYFKGDTLQLLRDAIKADFDFGMEDGKFDFFDDMEDTADEDAKEDAVDELLDEFTGD
jgi:KaiC/GvpD/RAD55 family RecA-like ATPase